VAHPQNPPPPPHDDLEATTVLLDRARHGDERAWNCLYKRYEPIMLRWAHGRLPASCRPLDSTQTLVVESFAAAFAQSVTFEYRREGAFLAFLRTIFMNLLRDKYRAASARPQWEPFREDVAGAADPGADVERALFWEAYERALGTLPEHTREAVMLRLEFDWSYERIAADIGSPSKNAARMLVTRGIGRLAEVMRDVDS